MTPETYSFSSRFTLNSIQANTEETNRNHNSLTPDVTNIFFTHGEIDPWRPMGVQSNVNADTPVVILANHAHCQDLSSISERDSAEMRATKLAVTANVRKWLGM